MREEIMRENPYCTTISGEEEIIKKIKW